MKDNLKLIIISLIALALAYTCEGCSKNNYTQGPQGPVVSYPRFPPICIERPPPEKINELRTWAKKAWEDCGRTAQRDD